MKRFILLAGLVLFVFLTYPPALLAQGTANCKVSGSGTSRKCDTVNNCDPDYEPPSGICIDLTNCDTAPVSCVPTQPPVPAPPGTCPASRPFSVCQNSNPDSSRCLSSGPCFGGSGPPFQFCCTVPGYTPPACTAAPYCDPVTKPCKSGEFCNTVVIPGMPEGCSGVCNTLDSGTSAFCNEDVNRGVNTAIGCLLAAEPKKFVGQILGWGVGVGGGIAFLLIVYAGFQMATAGGDPKRVQAAKELLTSALAGLILIVLSVVLLNFIGVKILNLPGFAGNPDLNL